MVITGKFMLAFGIFAAIVLQEIRAELTVSDEDAWPTKIAVPKLKVREVVQLGLADVSDDLPRITESNCDLECLTDEMNKIVDSNRLYELYSFETMHANGQVELTVVDVEKIERRGGDMERSNRSDRKTRKKRQIFGYDTRFEVSDSEYLGEPPFSVVVKLSTGCSGTLIGKRHVLTAAQCVHNGKAYVRAVKKLRVGIRKVVASDLRFEDAEDAQEFKWIKVSEVFIPQGWKKYGASKLNIEHNYAVLKLKEDYDGDSMDFGVAASTSLHPDRRVHFASYDNPETSELMYRYCPILDNNDDEMYHHCDAEEASVGAGVYIRLWDNKEHQWARKVIGVFNGHRWIDEGKHGYATDYNVAVVITPLKYAQICLWLQNDNIHCGDIQYSDI
ncbi:serine protease 23-like [Ptychodera flava]|uniref:serine protease 23-like n=1 Tax=Ptychodera flava TaxID=63121 RepID=UPI00396A1B13